MLRFFLLSYLWSWSFWLPMVITYQQRCPDAGEGPLAGVPIWALVLALIGGYGPTVSALVLTGREEGRQGVEALLRKLQIWRVGLGWHLFAWLTPVGFVLVGMALYTSRGGVLGSPVWDRLVLVPVAVLGAVIFGPLGEELGWRGYAVPRLQHGYSALTTSLLIGLVWTFWHTPMFWAPGGTVVSGGPITLWAIAKYFFYLTGFSILYTWLVNNTRGSVLLAVVFHTSANAMIPLIVFPNRPDEASRMIDEWSILAIWLTALVVLVLYGPRTLTRRKLPEPRRSLAATESK